MDLAVLDMNHRFPNLGHASIVETLQKLAQEAREIAPGPVPGVRVISYDVRASGAIPETASRFPLVVGTGGPGSLDPRENDGLAPASQGVREDPGWEAPLFRFFDRILESEETSFLGICHSFGLLARWAGFAKPSLRLPSKGGKSAGAVLNILTESARRHPWFSRLWEETGGAAIRVLDSRLYDLLPVAGAGGTILAHESANGAGRPGEAVTMVELARDADGIHPRVWGVNHHPEIGDRGRQRQRLDRLAATGEVSEAWLAERRAALDAWNHSAATEHGLERTATYSFEAPLAARITRAIASGP